MRCGEHCSKADYLKMKAKTDAFLKLVKKEDPLFLKYGKQLADDMSEYDSELSGRFLFILSKDITLQELYEKEVEIIGELLQNILVDINEHN